MNRHLLHRSLRFYRSMDEAFKTPRYGCAIEVPTRRGSGLWAWLGAAVAAGLALVLIVAGAA